METEVNEDRIYLQKPILTADERMKYCESLAFDLAEERLRMGTATSQEVTFFLKCSTEREKAETAKINAEVKLAEAKITAIESSQKLAESTDRVLQALRKYQGTTYSNDSDINDEDGDR